MSDDESEFCRQCEALGDDILKLLFDVPPPVAIVVLLYVLASVLKALGLAEDREKVRDKVISILDQALNGLEDSS